MPSVTRALLEDMILEALLDRLDETHELAASAGAAGKLEAIAALCAEAAVIAKAGALS
ncbi:MAG: hypothetical protein JO303_11720 [Caulobacteraceae bacterium]|nr:hypothetical protein [Caulobacteraceae bacterium]